VTGEPYFCGSDTLSHDGNSECSQASKKPLAETTIMYVEISVFQSHIFARFFQLALTLCDRCRVPETEDPVRPGIPLFALRQKRPREVRADIQGVRTQALYK
jgi:hypothetical protein